MPNDPVSLTVINPANGKTIGEFPGLTDKAALTRLQYQSEVQKKWSRLSIEQRGELLDPVARQLLHQKQELAQLISIEMGKPITQSLAEIEKSALCVRHYIENAAAYLKPVEVQAQYRFSGYTYRPLGTVLGILPWNFPFWQAFRAGIPSLMAGNTFSFKHAPNVPGCAVAIEKLFEVCGDFAAIVQNLPVSIPTVPKLIESPYVHGVTFTGSEEAGAIVASHAGRNIKPCVLELGGSDPYLVMEDANLPIAARACAQSRMHNSGQSCIAAKRIIVMDEICDEFMGEFLGVMSQYRMGDPLDPQTTIGPLARANLRENLQRQVDDAISHGAQCLMGGRIAEGQGYYYPATVLLNPPSEAAVAHEEVFGPVATVFRVSNHQQVMQLANQSRYGLGAAIFSKRTEWAAEWAKENLEVGFIAVNATVKSDPALPFGGFRKSGFGCELGREGILSFTQCQTLLG